MTRLSRGGAIALACAAGFCFSATLPSHVDAAAKPQLKLTSKTLEITKQSKLTGSHLTPKVVYTILLAQPNLKKKKVEGLVGGGQSDAKGHLALKIQAPAEAKCGKATLYAYTTKSKSMITLAVTVSGCHAKPTTVPPPPPPSKPGS